MGDFGIVIVSRKAPRVVARLAKRIHREVPAARVRGILYERHVPKSLPERLRNFWSHLREPGYASYTARKALGLLSAPLRWIGEVLVRLAHACPPDPNGAADFSLADLARFAESAGGSLLVTTDLHSPEALEYVRRLHADLGIVYGARTLKPELYALPRLGSINLHKRKVPEYRGGGPVGLWELLEGQKEIGITVHRVEQEVDAGPIIHAASIPIEPYDNLPSLALKAAVVGDDLLIVAVNDFARGTVEEKPQTGPMRKFKAPKPHELARYQKQLAKRRPAYRAPRGRPAWKLLLRTLLFLPLAVARNWVYRFRQSFPVVILYHHLITDRPHHLGTPTDCFDRQVAFLSKCYRVASLREATEMLERRRVEAPTVVLTFDDGYAENFVNLRAVTEARGIPVSLFVSTAHVSNQQPFGHDLRKKQHGFRPLTWEQIQFLSHTGYEFGAHTRTHFDCGSTDLAALRDEIVGSKVDLEAHLGGPAKFFSFPWGLPENMSPPALELARATYPYIFSAAGGVNVPSRGAEVWFLHRCDHPSDLWELELLLQSLLDLSRLGNTLPGLVGEPSRRQSRAEASLLAVPQSRTSSLGDPGP